MGGWGYAWILGGSEELKPEPRTRYPIPSSRSCGWHILIRPPASITRRTIEINHPENNQDDNQEEEPDDAFEDAFEDAFDDPKMKMMVKLMGEAGG